MWSRGLGKSTRPRTHLNLRGGHDTLGREGNAPVTRTPSYGEGKFFLGIDLSVTQWVGEVWHQRDVTLFSWTSSVAEWMAAGTKITILA